MEVGTFIKLKHTPIRPQRLVNTATRVTAKVEFTGTPRLAAFVTKWRRKAQPAAGSTAAVAAGEWASINMIGPTPTAANQLVAGDYHTESDIPGQAENVEIEYYLEATGRQDPAAEESTNAAIKLPAQGADGPLSYKAVTQATLDAAATEQRNAEANQRPQTSGPLIGYSLRHMNVEEQVIREFDLTRSTTSRQTFNASGALSGDNIGGSFDPATDVTHIQLGQGPFKLIQISASANFDLAETKIKSAKVHIDYPDATDPLHTVEIMLTAAQPTGSAQFMANQTGSQTYSYWVEMVYDPAFVIGAVTDATRRSDTFVTNGRHIQVNLEQHSKLLPVNVQTGNIRFAETTIRQVQVRLAPAATTGEAHTFKLDATTTSAMRYIVPTTPATPTYHMRQTFFFKDDSATFDFSDQTATHVLVNEPEGLVFRMKPRLVDPTGLVEEAVLDARYTHFDTSVEQAVLHLTPAERTSEFAVLRVTNDPQAWVARPRFVLAGRDPVEAPAEIAFTSPEPFIGLKQAGLRVVYVEMLDDASIFTGDLRAIRVIFGRDVADATLPTVSVTLRSGATQRQVVIVPGVSAGQVVSVAVEVMRSGAAPTRRTDTLAASDDTYFVML
jgi:hypothetical protein